MTEGQSITLEEPAPHPVLVRLHGFFAVFSARWQREGLLQASAEPRDDLLPPDEFYEPAVESAATVESERTMTDEVLEGVCEKLEELRTAAGSPFLV